MWTQANIRREIVAEESIEASLRLAPLDDMSAGEFLTKGLKLEAVQYIIDVEGILTSLLTVASGLTLSMRCLTCAEMLPAVSTQIARVQDTWMSLCHHIERWH